MRHMPLCLEANHNTHLDSCVHTVGDTILMQVEPWFSHEVGKDFINWENSGKRLWKGPTQLPVDQHR